MYKYLLYFFALLSSFTVSAQDNFSEFIVNQKYGIVNVQNLEEKVAPVYTKRIFFSRDYIVFEKDSRVDMYQRITGNMIQFQTAEPHYHLYVNTSEFLHITTEQQKSALLDEQLNIAITFPYQYTSINNFLSSSFIIAKSNKGYDIYNTEQSFKLLHKQIKAVDYFIINVKNKEKIFENYTVFYGNGTVNVYTEKFKLLKVIPSGAHTVNEAMQALNPYFMAELLPEESAPIVVGQLQDWNFVTDESGFNIYEDQRFPQTQFKVKSEFQIMDDGGYVCVYNLYGKGRFSFKLNEAGKKALIPVKYQQLMGLQIVEKK